MASLRMQYEASVFPIGHNQTLSIVEQHLGTSDDLEATSRIVFVHWDWCGPPHGWEVKMDVDHGIIYPFPTARKERFESRLIHCNAIGAKIMKVKEKDRPRIPELMVRLRSMLCRALGNAATIFQESASTPRCMVFTCPGLVLTCAVCLVPMHTHCCERVATLMDSNKHFHDRMCSEIRLPESFALPRLFHTSHDTVITCSLCLAALERATL